MVRTKSGIEDISKSYFEHLYYSPGKSNSALVVYLDEVPVRLAALFEVLENLQDHASEWIFSFWGKLTPKGNGGVLEFLSKHGDGVAYVISEIDKTHEDFITPSFEISVACSISELKRLFATQEFHFSREFRLSGWLVPSNTKNLLLKNPKWIQGRFLFPSELPLAFCSHEEWRNVFIYGSDDESIKNLFESISE